METTSDREGETLSRSRIYVGGLGPNVTDDEIRKTFSGLGKVESVDVLRTKGRSFAYIDFLPLNPKSLPKLFSTYNGCMWKGGRLRLERAKEHYLLRMKREWAEDAELARNATSKHVDTSESIPSLEKPKKLLTIEKPPLRMFFPKLNKMKSVPFSGSGKHKYSFQRITVPAHPVHFCDCEEHYDSSHLEKEKPSFDLENADDRIKEEEINMMESVMNKLFEKETHPKAVHSKPKFPKEGDYSVDPIGLPDDDNVSDPLSDEEDDFIINMVGGGNERIPLLGSRGQRTSSANQGPTYGGSKISQDRPYHKLNESPRKKIEPYNKKRKSPLPEVADGNGIGSKRKGPTTEPDSRAQQSQRNLSWSQKSAWRDLVGKKGDTPFQISHVVPSIPSTKEVQPVSDNLNMPHSANMERDMVIEKGNFQVLHVLPSIPSGRKERDLVGKKGDNTPFQISHVVPSIPSAKEEKPGSDDLNVPHSTNMENQNLPKHGNPENEVVQPKDVQAVETPALPNEGSIKYARGAAWLQKSSWTQLVADANKSSFSISQVLPGLTFEKQELLQPNGSNDANSKDVEKKLDQIPPTGDSYEDLNLTNKYLDTAPGTYSAIALPKSSTGPATEKTTMEEKQNEATAQTFGNRLKQTSIIDFGETCSFMRSADSLKEWAKAKAALSGSLKKKSEGK